MPFKCKSGSILLTICSMWFMASDQIYVLDPLWIKQKKTNLIKTNTFWLNENIINSWWNLVQQQKLAILLGKARALIFLDIIKVCSMQIKQLSKYKQNINNVFKSIENRITVSKTVFVTKGPDINYLICQM